MTYSRLVFTSRAPLPSDWYRAHSPPWLPLPRRAIPSRDSRASDAFSDVHLCNLTNHRRYLHAGWKLYPHNSLISLTKVIKSLTVRSIVPKSRTTRALTTCGGSQGSGTNPRDLSRMPSVHAFHQCIYALRQKKTNGPESLLSFFFDHRSLLSYLKASLDLFFGFLLSFSRRRFNSGHQQWAS